MVVSDTIVPELQASTQHEMLLFRAGYLPLAVRPEDRSRYLDPLEHGSRADDLQPFQTVMHETLDATLGDCLAALRDALPGPEDTA